MRTYNPNRHDGDAPTHTADGARLFDSEKSHVAIMRAFVEDFNAEKPGRDLSLHSTWGRKSIIYIARPKGQIDDMLAGSTMEILLHNFLCRAWVLQARKPKPLRVTKGMIRSVLYHLRLYVQAREIQRAQRQ